MSATSTPYGIQPASSQSGIVRPLRMPLGIPSGLAQNIYKYQAVTIDTITNPGTLLPVTNPGGTPQRIFGIFSGVEFTPKGGRPAESTFWASGTVYDTSYDMNVYLWPVGPDMRFLIQADGSVGQALMGSQFNITNPTASNSLGLSQCTVGAGGVAANSQGQFTLVEFSPFVNDPASGPGPAAGGDAFTDLTVMIAYPWVGGYAPSLG